jgi:S1-C subfamily serine protease
VLGSPLDVVALDVVLVVAAVLFALSGYRQGFVVGVLSFVGFLGGGVLGARVAPRVAELDPLVGFSPSVVGLAVVFLAATVGQVLATLVGGALRRRLTWRSARWLDAAGGAVVSVLSLLLVAWLVGRAVASSPYPELASQVRRSAVMTTVDGLVPDAGRRFLGEFRNLIDERGFPEVFSDLQAADEAGVPPPDARLVQDEAVRQVQPSVLKVTGVAQACRKRIEGSGFVYAPERVMTNAHVVAGVREPQVEVVRAGGVEQLDATVVLFDPARDVAVLAVDGLGAAPLLPAEQEAERGQSAIVVGYPQDGPFRPDAARVIRTQDARGKDIYQQEDVLREIYSVRGLVRQGNSGGPLVDTDGRVLGVVFAAAADDQTIGYVLTWDEVSSSAEQARTRTAEVSTRDCG